MELRDELSKVDPKCWLCGVVVIPTVLRYQPLICSVCLPEYKQRKFVFTRPSQEEMEEIIGHKRSDEGD